MPPTTQNPSLREDSPPSGIARRSFPARFEVRAKADGTGGTRYELEGYASIYDTPYEMWDWCGAYMETVAAGAGAKTLAENPDVVLVLNHEGMPMARTKAGSLELTEDSTGLHMRAPNLPGGLTVVRDVVLAVEEGLLDEMSFAFRILRWKWSPDYTQFDITEYSIHRGDVSVVTFGANPATTVDLRGADVDAALERMTPGQLAEAHKRIGAKLAGDAPDIAAPPAAERTAPAGLPLSLALALAATQDQA